jgi:PAT family beta-lactamase induction signal transducer AmpG
MGQGEGVARFLDAFRSRRVWLLIGLGFASGLPYTLSGQTLIAWMTNWGVSLKTVGLFSLVSLPYNLKVIWAPALDRYTLPFLGRRRGWMLLFQVALAAVILAMSQVNPRLVPVRMAAFAVLLAFCSASQDIVSDAYRADILRPEERASGTATYLTGYRVAMLLTQAGALIVSDHLPWPRVYQLLAVLMLTGVIATVLAPEPVQVGVVAPRSLGDAVVKPFVNLFARNRIAVVLAFVLLYKFGEYVSDAMVLPFLIKSGYTNTQIGTIRKFMGFAGTVAGVMLGGGLTVKLGMRKALLIFGILEAVTNSGYIAISLVGKSLPLLVVVTGVDNFFRGMAAAAQGAFLLSICDRSFSATQFALLSSATSFAGRLFASISGFLVAAVGWPVFFGFTIVMGIPALLLLPLVPIEEPGDAPAGAEPRPA